MLKMTRLEQCMYDRRNRTPLVEALSFREKVHAVRTEGFARITAMASAKYDGQNYIPMAILNDMIERTDPQPHHRIAVFDQITRSILDLLGCKDVTLFDRGDGFLASDMKFDIVIGNPPYQNREENSDGSLWLKFVNHGMQQLVDDGVLTYVTPTSWVGKTTRTAKADWSPFTDGHVVFYRPLDDAAKKRHFGDVGSTFGYFVLKRGSGLTNLVLNDGKIVQHQLLEGEPLPKNLDQTSYSIHQKLSKFSKFDPLADFSFHSQKLKKNHAINDTPDHQYQHKTYYSHNLVRYSSQTQRIYADLKVMIPIVGTLANAWYDHNCNITEDVRYLVVDSQQAAENLVSLFRSNVYAYIDRQYRAGRNLGMMLRFMPFFDPTRTWTDHDIYAAIGLDAAEISYIGNTIGR